MNKFQPVSDSSRTFWIQFPYGDFRGVPSTQTNQTDFQVTVEIEEGKVPWFCSPFVHAFLLSVAHATGQQVQVNQQGKEPVGIQSGTQWEVMRVDHRPEGGGRAFPRWYIWPKGRQEDDNYFFKHHTIQVPKP